MFSTKEDENIVKEETSIYSWIIESDVSNTLFEIVGLFFPGFFHCTVLSRITMSTTQHETPDSHHPDYSLIAIDFFPPPP